MAKLGAINIVGKNGFLEEHPQIARMPSNYREWNAFVQTLQRWIKDTEYEVEMTTTLSFDPEITFNAQIHRTGKLVCMRFPTISGTSDSVNFAFGNLPTELSPTRDQTYPMAGLVDNGSNIAAGEIQIGSSGSIIINTSAGGSWTASGTKGIDAGSSVIYSIFNAEQTT